jgi:hypothetical protein
MKLLQRGELNNNDLVCVESESALEPIIWKGKITRNNTTNDSAPVCIKANTLEENVPFEDLYLSPKHRIILKGKMVEALDLVNRETIYQDYKIGGIQYYHIELKTHAAIVANGVLSETYLDTNNRHSYETE